MKVAVVTATDAKEFEVALQKKIDEILDAKGRIEDIKFATAAGLDSGAWSALILYTEREPQRNYKTL